MQYDSGPSVRVHYSPATQRRVLAALSALARNDYRKGAITVRALLEDMTDDEVFLHLISRGRRSTIKSIRYYRTALRTLGFDVRCDGELNAGGRRYGRRQWQSDQMAEAG